MILKQPEDLGCGELGVLLSEATQLGLHRQCLQSPSQASPRTEVRKCLATRPGPLEPPRPANGFRSLTAVPHPATQLLLLRMSERPCSALGPLVRSNATLYLGDILRGRRRGPARSRQVTGAVRSAKLVDRSGRKLLHCVQHRGRRRKRHARRQLGGRKISLSRGRRESR